MTAVRRLAPDAAEVELEALLAELHDAPALEPFGETAIAACDAVARALFHDPAARSQPDLVALATWLRRASTTRLATEAAALGLRVPRGLAFHVPPANVDAMAMYSLGLSLLAGNRNIVRISGRAGHATQRICAALALALADPQLAPVRAGTAVLTWGHEPEPTRLCSAACDVRVLWGGDDTVASLRGFPTQPGARDLAFVDRFSMAALRAAAWLDTPEPVRERLAAQLYNDAYWYDQQGCSSPRLVVWCGDTVAARAAGQDLFDRLHTVLDARGYDLPLGARTAKLAWLAGAAIDRPVQRVQSWSNTLSVLTLSTLDGLDRSHPGGGTFLQAVVPTLDALAAHVSRRDQTLAVFGFPRDELERFVGATAGRGIDRIVPLGEALKFDHRWDGMDLLSELTRAVTIAPAAGHLSPVAEP
jgi:hypothetical protein